NLNADFALLLADPVPAAHSHRLDRKRPARPYDNPRRVRLDPNHIEWFLLAADLDSASLAYGKMDYPTMPSEQAPVEVDNLAFCLGLRAQALHQPRVVTIRHKADVLAVRLGGDLEFQLRCNPPHLVLGKVAQRETYEVELLARG